MKFQEFKDNFKCPKCTLPITTHPTGRYHYCDCRSCFLVTNSTDGKDVSATIKLNKIPNANYYEKQFEYELTIYITNVIAIHYKDYGKPIWLDNIPDWIVSNSIVNRLETLITFS